MSRHETQVCASIVRLGSSQATLHPIDDVSHDRISAALQVETPECISPGPYAQPLHAGGAARKSPVLTACADCW